MKSVSVSVVLPTFNQIQYLPAAIKSILEQTFGDFELIIVNDGSTDQTTEFLNQFKHPKVTVISQANKGLPAALNAGFKAASGKYFTWTSTDNVVGPTWLEELVRALDNASPDVGYAMSYYAGIDEQDNILFVNRDLHFDVLTMLTRHTGNASFLYRATLAEKVGAYDESLSHAEDLDMWVRMAGETPAVCVESVLYYYRLHSQSMTANQDKVRDATKRVVLKYLAPTNGQFDLDKLFPFIASSPDPALERWKAKLYLATLCAKATFYCPVDAVIYQLALALSEKYESGLVANIVHLLARDNRWADAEKIVAIYAKEDNSDLLNALTKITANLDNQALQAIPFLTLEEKWFGTNELRRNIVIPTAHQQVIDASLQKIVMSLVNKVEDQQHHPEVWQYLGSLRTPEQQEVLMKIRDLLAYFLTIPQSPEAMPILETLEAMCYAFTSQVEIALAKLKSLNDAYPQSALIAGALSIVGDTSC